VDGSTNSIATRNAVRAIPRADFDVISRAGLLADGEQTSDRFVVEEVQAEYDGRRRLAKTLRPIRDAAFSRAVKKAYRGTCAMTGLRLVDHLENFEVDAAHIRSVEHNGPDSPRNGLALTGTMHWLFDHGLLSVLDDGRILKSSRLPGRVADLLNQTGMITPPENLALAPHPIFLRWHRENRFRS
jgi:putative restriction endonuclease